MLKRLQVRNFKSLRELEVEFGRLTVLVGANGCGKTSVLQAIKLVRDLALAESGEDARIPVGVLSQPAPGASIASAIHIDLEFPDDKLSTRIVPKLDEPGAIDEGASKITLNSEDDGFGMFFSAPRGAAELLRPVNLYALDKRVMEPPTYSEEASPVIGAQGENLATVLDAMQGFQRERFQEIEDQLRQLVPGLRQIRLQRVKLPFMRSIVVEHEIRKVKDSVVGHQVLLDFEFARGVSASLASEGTLLLLGLLTVINQESGTKMTVMLDDLDRALHPKAQRQLVEHLHQLLDQRPELQIIATSHSPYLVEHLAYEEVLAMTQSPEDGRSLIARLTEHPDAERWREEMSAGEFWSSVGEDWVIEANKP